MQAMVKMREDYPEVRKLLRNELEWKYGSSGYLTVSNWLTHTRYINVFVQ